MRFPRLPVKDANGPCWECEVSDVEDCSDFCGHGHCDHASHCDVCGVGLDYNPESGICFICEAAWLASHQLCDS